MTDKKRLEFGTGGIRAKMGVDGLNLDTIKKATQGVAAYLLKKQDAKKKAVVIGYDSRYHSREFAKQAACTLAGAGIPVYLCSDIRPTPFISFLCKELGCAAGIMITASHNPKQYNGYKVYAPYGGQVVAPDDALIVEEVANITSKTKDADFNDPLIMMLSDQHDQLYLDAIATLPLLKKQPSGNTVKITYSSLHGTGITLMPKALEQCGFTNFNLVKAQCVPNGNFPTCPFPNPELPETCALGMLQMLSTNSDLLLLTDPDADRLGVAVNHQGTAQLLTGNEVAALLIDYICKKAPPKKGAFITTVVSSPLLQTIATSYNYPCFSVLTGFKYIGQMMEKWRETNEHEFLFGAEESGGFLVGTLCRDKDGISAGCLVAAVALAAKQEGKTLVDKLHELYAKQGAFLQNQLSTKTDNPAFLMKNLRKNPPKTVLSEEITQVIDYLEPQGSLPKSDMLCFVTGNGTKIIVRPSGTEPKVKWYIFTKERTLKAAETKLERLLKETEQLSATFS